MITAPDNARPRRRSLSKTQRAEGRDQFSDWLREALSARGLSQADLARSLAVNSGMVSKWYNGTCIPDEGNLVRISDTLGISVHTLRRVASGLQSTDPAAKQPNPEIYKFAVDYYRLYPEQQRLVLDFIRSVRQHFMKSTLPPFMRD